MKIIYASDTNIKQLENFSHESFNLDLKKTKVIDYSKFPIFLSGDYKTYFEDIFDDTNTCVIFIVKLETISFNYNFAINGQSFSEDLIYNDVSNFLEKINALDKLFKYTLISSFSSFNISNIPETYKLNSQSSLEVICSKANIIVSDWIKEKSNFFQIPKFFNPFLPNSKRDKLNLISKNIYFQEELKKLVSFVIEQIRIIETSKIKLIILDLDNTLWGGVAGDDGIDNLKLGGHDSIGECFQLIQKCFKYFKEMGILLAIASKNNEETVKKIFFEHPSMFLKFDDFVDYKINWEEKSINIIEIVKNLNIGMESVLFVDDNPVEREKVKASIKEIIVFDFPDNIFDLPYKLTTFLNLYQINTTTEDKQKTLMYKQNNERNKAINSKFEGKIKNLKEFLELETFFQKTNKDNFSRVSQLINKTNQFNLSGRRYGLDELKKFLFEKNIYNLVVSANDKFGDYGLISILIYRVEKKHILIEEFVMSCRILGRGIEDEIITKLKTIANKKSLKFNFIETKKNQVMKKFLCDNNLI